MTAASPTDQSHEVAIIGASFAGLQAALYLLRARRRVVIFDDGQHRNRFAAHSHAFLGQDGVAPEAIKALGLAQISAYPTLLSVAERVEAVSGEIGDFALTTASGRFHAQRLILATGQRDILPDVPGLAECWGKTVVHCPYCHGYELADRPTGLMLGGMPMGAHYLKQVRRWAGPLVIFDNGLPLAPEVLARIAEEGLHHAPGPLQEFHHRDGTLDAVSVAGMTVPLNAFYMIGTTEPAAPFAKDLGCAMEAGQTGPLVQVDAMGRTTVPGVFAAGDLISARPAAILAAASGANAGLTCDQELAGLFL
jgi:thioredoxin reductase